MEAEERLEERPVKKIKLEHSARGDRYALAEEDTSIVVPRLQMCVEDRGEGWDHLGSTGVNVTETNELDADVSETPVSEDNAEPEIPVEQTGSVPPLSKNALKKIRNKERWDAGREARKLKRKQKIAEKRIRKREAKEEAQAAAAAQAVEVEASGKDKPRRPLHTLLPVSVIIDCGFDNLMTEREMISLGSQLTRSYSDNHKAPFQAHMFVSSWGGQLKQRFDTVLEKHHENWRGVTFTEEDFVAAAERAKELMKEKTTSKLTGAFRARRSDKISIGSSFGPVAPKAEDGDMAVQEDLELGAPPPTVAISDEREGEGGEISAPAAKANAENQENGVTIEPKLCASRTPGDSKQTAAAGLVQSSEGEARHEGEIVYLTSDSPHTLDRLQPYSTYIVGGLVDKNRHKGICYKTACARGIKTAKLPIGEFMEMQSRYVLATNHVVEIMVRWLECGDWGESFIKVMPKRKGGVLKAADGTKQDVHGAELGVEDSSPGSGSSGEREAHLDGGDELENGQHVHSVSNEN